MKIVHLSLFAALLLAAAPASAQLSPSGTAGAANATAASPGGVPPTVPGTGPGSTSPGGINGVPEAPRGTPPSANPNQVPNSGPIRLCALGGRIFCRGRNCGACRPSRMTLQGTNERAFEIGPRLGRDFTLRSPPPPTTGRAATVQGARGGLECRARCTRSSAG